MTIDKTKFKFPERYTQPHPYLPIRVGKKGEIFSQPKTDKPVKVLKPKIGKDGYERVCVYVDGKRKWFMVHRLVWETYNQQRIPEGMQVNHINELKTGGNNRPENLNLMTCKENNNWGTRNARVAKSLSKPVLQIDLDNNVIREWPSTREVERQTGLAQSNISKACRGKLKQAYGFKWKYK